MSIYDKDTYFIAIKMLTGEVIKRLLEDNLINDIDNHAKESDSDEDYYELTAERLIHFESNELEEGWFFELDLFPPISGEEENCEEYGPFDTYFQAYRKLKKELKRRQQ